MLLEKLTQAFGVSGYETEVTELVRNEVQGFADEMIVDALGNLIVLKKGAGGDKKKIMLAAHMDEVGVQVIKIEKDGLIKVKTLGFLWVEGTYMNRMAFRNGTVGIVGGKLGEGKNEFHKLYLDIGAKTKEDAEKFVQIGDVATFIGGYAELQGNNVAAKAMDDRIGCYILIETLKRIPKHHHDLYFTFTVQEELGCRGGIVAANRIQPDLGLSVDITPAHDYPCDLEGNNELGAGVAIKISDPSVICDEKVVRTLISCCEKNQIKYQRDVMDKGGTDSGAINRSGSGVAVSGVSIVTRYPHGPNSMVNMDDVEGTIRLLTEYLSGDELGV